MNRISSILWRPEDPDPSIGKVTHYIGEVCIEREYPFSLHAFVSLDAEGNQFTAFVDLLTL